MRKLHAMSDSETEVMKIIWKHDGIIMLSELLVELEKLKKSWKRTTVLTFLTRMVGKGLVVSEKIGRSSQYSTLITEDEYMDGQTKTFLDKVYNGSAKNLISALLKKDCLTDDDITELKEFWNEGSVLDE